MPRWGQGASRKGKRVVKRNNPGGPQRPIVANWLSDWWNNRRVNTLKWAAHRRKNR